MAGTYKLVEIVGTSPKSFYEAVKNAIAEGEVQEFQVTLKVGFRIERQAGS